MPTALADSFAGSEEVRRRISDDHSADLDLAHLSEAADENHLLRQIVLDGGLKVTSKYRHARLRKYQCDFTQT